jgi:hypothetical protein
MVYKKPVAEKPKGPFGDNGLIEVLVMDSYTHKPVIGAGIVFQGGDIIYRADVHTNMDGLAYIVLPAGTYTLARSGGKYYKPKNLDMEIRVDAGQTQALHIELDHKSAFRGMVVDEGGQPIGGAILEFFFPSKDQSNIVTKADGRYSFTYDPKNVARLPSLLIVTHKRRNLGTAIRPKYKYDDDLVIVLRPLISATGTVTDSDGKVLKDAEIEIHITKGGGSKITFRGKMGAISTDSQGHYKTPGFPPLPKGFEYHLKFTKGWYYAKSIKLEPDDLVPGGVLVRDMSIIPGERIRKQQR